MSTEENITPQSRITDPDTFDISELYRALLQPDREELADTPLVSARETKNTGSYPVANTVKEVVGYPRIDNRLAASTVKALLRRNPEPEAGLLRIPDNDAELQPFFTNDAKGRDKQLARIQKEVYQTLRPVCYTLHFLESTDLSQQADAASVASMARKLQDVLSLGFHAAEGIRLERRTQLAKSAHWSPNLIAACEEVESSAEFDAMLFGPEFCQRFHDEARNWKHHRIITVAHSNTNNKPRGRSSGSRPFGTNHFCGGGQSFRGHNKKAWGNYSGGGTSADTTSNRSASH
ncbi:hypothetical protein BJV82DRAFT_204265 [Fennellomyces sp. T-0311]|nr:hypothetical protein BJV82DRAFT_204265 [Fennellomyces sp. T-0311]